MGPWASSAADTADWFRTNGAEIVFQALTFLLILFAFWILARIARGTVRRLLERSKLEISSLAKDFFIKMTSRTVVLLGFLIALAQLGLAHPGQESGVHELVQRGKAGHADGLGVALPGQPYPRTL